MQRKDLRKSTLIYAVSLKKIDQLRIILEGSNVDIFTLSETWLHDKVDSSMVNIQGYNTFRQDRDSSGSVKRRGGGLITYVKSSLDAYIQETVRTSTKELEVRWLRIVRENAKNLILANVYRPQSGKVNLAMKALDTSINSLKSPNKEMVIIGDLNIDYKNHKSPTIRHYNFLRKPIRLIKTLRIQQETRDVAFMDMKYIKAAGTLDSFLSDHQPFFVLKKKIRNKEKSKQQFVG